MLKSSFYMERLVSTDRERSSREVFPGTVSQIVFISRKLDPSDSTERGSVPFLLAVFVPDKTKAVSIQKGGLSLTSCTNLLFSG